MLDADQWDFQATMARLNASLIARGYVTWFDLTNMKGPSGSEHIHSPQMSLCRLDLVLCSGSTMDAMSDAIEGAAVMLYGVSLKYKESANVRFVLLSMWHLPCIL